MAIYSDASSIPRGTGIGVGVAVYSLDFHEITKIDQRRTNIGPSQLVYNGELEGIVAAAEYAVSTLSSAQDIIIFADNQAAIHRLAKPSDNPGQSWQIRLIEAGQQLVNKGSTLSIQWVPGHEDVIGNEEADKLAKQAAKFTPDTYSTSLAMVRTKIKSRTKKE